MTLILSVLAASLVGRSGRVIAFEPFPAHAERLRANAALNDFSQVELRPAALAGAVGKVSFVTNRDVSNRIQTRTDADSDTIEVDCTTLDQALGDLPDFTIAKLDLEGSEIDALDGAGRLLGDANPAVWIVEWNVGLIGKRGHSPAELIGRLESHGFRLVEVQGERLVPAAPPEWSGNIVAVHDSVIAAVEARLKERPAVAPARWTLPRPANVPAAR